jgi:hypothetical protein
MSRLTTWLKRSISTSTTPTSPKPLDAPFYRCDTTRPSSSSSHTTRHTRQDSQESATVTLLSSSPSSRAASPATSPPRKKRVPAPLVLKKEMHVEVALRSGRELKPPVSPHANLLRGMEISAKDVGLERRSFLMPSPGAVGIAF